MDRSADWFKQAERDPSRPSPTRPPSWSGVVVTWLDRGARVERVRQALQRLMAKRADVSRAVLFGSLARGTGTAASDVDLLVEVDAPSPEALRDLKPALLLAMRPLPCAVDLVLRTPAQMARSRAAPDPLLDEIEATGVVLGVR